MQDAIQGQNLTQITLGLDIKSGQKHLHIWTETFSMIFTPTLLQAQPLT